MLVNMIEDGAFVLSKVTAVSARTQEQEVEPKYITQKNEEERIERDRELHVYSEGSNPQNV